MGPLLVAAHDEQFVTVVRELFTEYAAWLDYDLCLQNFEQELAALPGAYAPPGGRLYIAILDKTAAGCVALRPKGELTGEIKRLYVRPAYRGLRIGRLLAEQVINDSRLIGYRTLVLDTLPVMQEAISLYRSLGFVPTHPPSDAPQAGEIYFSMSLE